MTDNSSIQIYQQYLQQYFPELDISLLPLFKSARETDWENPSTAIDLNNFAVIQIIEAENAEDMALRQFYLELALEALETALSQENHPLCAAHLGVIKNLMGEANIARQIEYSRLLDILPIIFDSQEEQVAGLVYLPSDGRNRHKGQKTLEKIIKLNNSYLQAFYLLPLDLISQLVEEEEQSSNGQTNYHGEQVPVSNSTTKIQLHIGGKEVHPDWKILDIESRPEVDYVGDASRLDLFEDNSVDAIYASHVLEHFYYGINNELTNTLKEWHRVLQPGGKLFISVPNLKTICYLYLNPKFTLKERFHLMRIIFGGQTNIYDVHKVGFDIDILGMYLQSAGFKKWGQVSEFNIFNDCSGLRILDTLISLNVIATK